MNKLIPRVQEVRDAVDAKAKEFKDVVKIGRTHLQDATPLTVGQEMSGWASLLERDIERMNATLPGLYDLAIGGTAVGTGLNAHPEFAERAAKKIAELTGLPFKSHPNKFAALSAHDEMVFCSGGLKTLAASLMKIANDVRWLASGPRCGLGELVIPENEPGSSIMPGKVNPVIAESAMQVVCRVLGNDTTVTTAALGGIGSLFELNVAMPVMIDAFLESLILLANVSNVMVDKLLTGLVVNEDRCRELIDQSLMMVTALAPKIGYEKAALFAKDAFESGKTIRELCRERKVLPDAELDDALDPWKMTEPRE
jgi:fumarate hydratase class II